MSYQWVKFIPQVIGQETKYYFLSNEIVAQISNSYDQSGMSPEQVSSIVEFDVIPPEDAVNEEKARQGARATAMKASKDALDLWVPPMIEE